MDLKFSWDCRPLLAPGSKFLWVAGSTFSLQPGNSSLKLRSIDEYVRNQTKQGIIAETRRQVVTPHLMQSQKSDQGHFQLLSILISKDSLNAR